MKLSFLIPLQREIDVFAVQDPSKNDLKSVQKGTLQPDPPKIVHVRPQGAPGWQHDAKRLPKGSLLGGPGQDPETAEFDVLDTFYYKLMRNTSVFDGFRCQNLSWSQDGPQEPRSLGF